MFSHMVATSWQWLYTHDKNISVKVILFLSRLRLFNHQEAKQHFLRTFCPHGCQSTPLVCVLSASARYNHFSLVRGNPVKSAFETYMQKLFAVPHYSVPFFR